MFKGECNAFITLNVGWGIVRDKQWWKGGFIPNSTLSENMQISCVIKFI